MMVAPPRKRTHLETEVRGADDIPRPCSESPVNGKRIMGFLEDSPRIISPRRRLTEQPTSNRYVCGYEHGATLALTGAGMQVIFYLYPGESIAADPIDDLK